MRLHSVKVRGMSVAFRDQEAAIDFDQLPTGLIALVGRNGTGKTTLMESMAPAPIYREFPSYAESVADHVAPGVRDAMIDVVFSIGATRYRALVQADPQFGGGRGKTEAYLWRDAGDPAVWTPIAGPLVRDFDAAIAAILPPRELFLASVFACQGGSGSFFGLKETDRKRLFVEMLGIDHLQDLAQGAKGRGGTAEGQLELVRDRLATARERTTQAEALDREIGEAAILVAASETALAVREGDLALLRRNASDAREALARAEAESDAARAERDRLQRAIADDEQREGDLGARLDRLRDLLDRAPAIEDAATTLTAVDAELAAAREREQAATADVAVVQTQLAGFEERRQALLADHRRAKEDVTASTAARERLAAQEGLLERAGAEEELERFLVDLEALDLDRPALQEAVEAERARAGKRDQLTARLNDYRVRTGLLAKIPGVPACDTCPLTTDARQARDAVSGIESALAKLAPLEPPPADALREHEKKRGQLAIEIETLRREMLAVASRKVQLAADEQTATPLPERQSRLDEVTKQGLATAGEITKAKEQFGACRATAQIAAEDRARFETKRAELAVDAGRLPELRAAQAQRDEVVATLAQVRAGLAAARQAAGALPTHDLETPRAKVAQVDSAVSAAEHDVRTIAGHLSERKETEATLRGQRQALGDPQAERAALTARETTLGTEVADWALLERALGRDGVQALEIDAAGPAVTSLANDLLSTCYGPRFQLALDTTAMTKDGKKQREVFTVRILDGVTGREAKRGSGGEQVVFDEALRLALAIFNAQRSGYELRTLWRDETAGALDPENANSYVAMLRRALEIGGFERCIYIAHQPAVWEQADARIFVEDGAARLDVAA